MSKELLTLLLVIIGEGAIILSAMVQTRNQPAAIQAYTVLTYIFRYLAILIGVFGLCAVYNGNLLGSIYIALAVSMIGLSRIPSIDNWFMHYLKKIYQHR